MEYEVITNTNFEQIRKKVSEAKESSKKVIFQSNDDELNLKIMEKLDIDVILINESGRKDFSKQRNSGFNQVMSKLAKKKKITLGVNLYEIIHSKGNEKAEIISRIIQNINLAKKDKLNVKFISKNQDIKDEYDIKALGLILGMNTKMAQDCV